eukprot:gnl/TRDRNA2_/TRDRNA2_175573_c0_seq1.p1 gnl/TRDRNA2_/TRDRNA2_175573_c0~~gnl/TRDRNA2_/TRDRNA2_175573_c0_seq1.p1  ORF type:complete len:662 (-),score=127.27 gnl/TRDRNA2_/TRDRNA2_175573_c0_seq1:209-2194(-)
MLKPLRKLLIDHVSQMSISPGSVDDPSVLALAAFCPAGTSASPVMIRVYADFAAGRQNRPQATEKPRLPNFLSEGGPGPPAITKSFFSDVAWATMRWDPCSGTDLLVLVHASELTEADVEGRTLHGQGGSGLYLLRVEDSSEPIAALSGNQEGRMILDARWCPGEGQNGARSIVMLQGPQPALVSVYSYRRGQMGSPMRLDLGSGFGVRNCLAWDTFGRSFCLYVRSLRGAGVSNEADCLDLMDSRPDGGGVAWRSGAAVGGRKKDKGEAANVPFNAVGPSVSSVEFSPDGQVLLTIVTAGGVEQGAELKFITASDGKALYRLKFEDIGAASWRPTSGGSLPPPEFPAPPTDSRGPVSGPTGAGAAIGGVSIRTRAGLLRKIKGLQTRLKETQRLRAHQASPQDAERLAQLEATDASTRSTLARLEQDVEQLERNQANLRPGEPERITFEVQLVDGVHALEGTAGENCRELARRFCRDKKLDARLVSELADRLESLLHGTRPGSNIKCNEPPRHHGPKPAAVDLKDRDAVLKRVRALQKKLREIENLKSLEGLDQLQREKLRTEESVRSECAALEAQLRELDLPPPTLVFDIETEPGVIKHLEYRDGDNCAILARNFCEENNLDEEMEEALTQHMNMNLPPEQQGRGGRGGQGPPGLGPPP